MLQTLTNFASQRFGDRAFTLAVAVAVLGIFVWLLGARFSKSILALIGVGIGAFVGMNLPRWYGWNFDGMALGMGAALLCGFAGYMLHTTWLGGALVGNLAILFGFTTWAVLAGNATWKPPTVDFSAGQVEILRTLWRSMPGDLPRVMPYAVAIGVLSAVAMAVFWPKTAKSLSWSLIGLQLMLVGGAVALLTARPNVDTSGYLPASAGARAALLWILASVGMLVQWWSLPAWDSAPVPKSKAPATPQPGALATGGAKA